MSDLGFHSVAHHLEGMIERRDQLASKVIPTGICYLDDCMLGLHPTDLVVVSAATGAGKTTAGLFMAAQAAENGLRVHFLALEAFRGEIEARLLFRELSSLASQEKQWTPTLTFARWMHGLCRDFAIYEAKAKANLQSRLRTMNTLYRASSFTHEDITRQLLAIQGQTDLVVLDHLHYVDTDGPFENGELKKIIKSIRDTSLAMEVPVVVICHLRKKQGLRGNRGLPEIDDIHGSSDIAKAATKIVMLAPCPSVPFGEEGGNRRLVMTAVQVLKDRYAGASNYVGLIGFDLSKMEYGATYGVARLDPAGNTLIHLGMNERPHWATKRGLGLKGELGEETKLA